MKVDSVQTNANQLKTTHQDTFLPAQKGSHHEGEDSNSLCGFSESSCAPENETNQSLKRAIKRKLTKTGLTLNKVYLLKTSSYHTFRLAFCENVYIGL